MSVATDACSAARRAWSRTCAGARAPRVPTSRSPGVAKIFRRGGDETHALDRIDLTIRAGEFLAIVGPSGCGKSTLLRIVAGLHLADAPASVRVDGRVVDRPQTDLGIVFQSPVLLDWRNVARQRAACRSSCAASTRAPTATRAHELLAQVGPRANSPTAIRTSCPAACASASRSCAR